MNSTYTDAIEEASLLKVATMAKEAFFGTQGFGFGGTAGVSQFGFNQGNFGNQGTFGNQMNAYGSQFAPQYGQPFGAGVGMGGFGIGGGYGAY